MSRPPVFAELCAGLASVSLMLQHGKHCKPPVSRMGNKHGYALAILRVMGLRPGQGAESFLWCEPDPGCRALLTAYTDPALMREAAGIIRGWKDEDPRELWERLRAEGPIRDFGAREAARWQVTANWAYRRGTPESGFNKGVQTGEAWNARCPAMADDCSDIAHASELARYLQVAASNRLINIDSATMRNSGKGGTTFGGGEFATGAERVAEAAREVARWTLSTGWTRGDGGLCVAPGACPPGVNPAISLPSLTRRMDDYRGLPAAIVPDAREIHPPADLPPGCVVFMDPPYVNTTGYGNDLPREQVCELAERWASAGAAVYISEAEPLSELDGWHEVEITSTRIGQKRTFSKQQREFLTCSKPPAWKPAIQQGLF